MNFRAVFPIFIAILSTITSIIFAIFMMTGYVFKYTNQNLAFVFILLTMFGLVFLVGLYFGYFLIMIFEYIFGKPKETSVLIYENV